MKKIWFRHYEALWNKRDAGELQATDTELASMATERMLAMPEAIKTYLVDYFAFREYDRDRTSDD